MYLRVLVDEHEGVGHVVVPQVDDGRADPVAHAALRLVQHLLQIKGRHYISQSGEAKQGTACSPQHTYLHRVEGARALLHAVQALARVPEVVAAVLREEVLLGQTPEPEHVVRDLPARPREAGQGRETDLWRT